MFGPDDNYGGILFNEPALRGGFKRFVVDHDLAGRSHRGQHSASLPHQIIAPHRFGLRFLSVVVLKLFPKGRAGNQPDFQEKSRIPARAPPRRMAADPNMPQSS